MAQPGAFRQLDRVLRGDATRHDAVRDGMIDTSAVTLVPLLVLLAMFYGLCMGSYAVVYGRAGAWRQMISSTLKVPALFFLTLLVTLPSLHVFNALIGSRLTVRALTRLLSAAMGVTVALLASFGTIVAFFSFTTDSHPFMVILNVAAFAVSGFMGLRFLIRTVQMLAAEAASPVLVESAPLAPRADSTAMIRVWVLLFALVGAQMSWILRPFIGGIDRFDIFRDPRGSNFFVAVYHLARRLLGAE